MIHFTAKAVKTQYIGNIVSFMVLFHYFYRHNSKNNGIDET